MIVFLSFPCSIIYVYPKDPIRCLGLEPMCSVSMPHRHPVGLIEKSVRPPKNRAVIYGLKVPAVYTTPLQFNSCYHGVTPQHYITGATAAPATSRCKWDHHQSQLGLSWCSSFVLIAL